MGSSLYKGRIIYITGGSSGIGLAAARGFSALGAHVIIFARGEERLGKAVKEIERSRMSKTQRVSSMSLDVADHHAVQEQMTRAVTGFGAPGVLINSAGIAYPDYFENIPQEKFRETVSTNLCGTWNTCSCLVPYMKPGGGHIVNISSIAGFLGVFGYTAYSASKFAVMGFSESLRSELRPYRIKVSVLCPPDTDTPQLREEDRTGPAETRAIAGNATVMSAEHVADAMIRGMGRGQFVIIPGVEGRFIHLAQRLFPGLVRRIMDAQVRKARKAASHE